MSQWSILLSTDKSKVGTCKSDCVKDHKYNILLSSLQGLPDKPPTTSPFPMKSLDFNDFLFLLRPRCNSLASGIYAISYKVYKKCPQPSPSKIEDFRPIAVLSVEVKLFFTHISNH